MGVALQVDSGAEVSGLHKALLGRGAPKVRISLRRAELFDLSQQESSGDRVRIFANSVNFESERYFQCSVDDGEMKTSASTEYNYTFIVSKI